MKHTKGPWISEGHSVYTKQGAFYIAEAKSNANVNASYVRPSTEARANAHLIAAAPEMLEAYTTLWAAVENGTIDKDFFELREQFRNVTDKAKGGA